jgi:hypothetical protein
MGLSHAPCRLSWRAHLVLGGGVAHVQLLPVAGPAEPVQQCHALARGVYQQRPLLRVRHLRATPRGELKKGVNGLKTKILGLGGTVSL